MFREGAGVSSTVSCVPPGQALLALSPRLSVAFCALGGQGTAAEQGHSCQPCSSCSRESDGQGKASAVVSAHGRREGGSSGRRENSDSLSLGRIRGSQVMSAQKTSCRGNSSRMCGEGGGDGNPW